MVGFFESKGDTLIDQRIDKFLSRFVEKYHSDTDLIQFFFEVITGILPQKRRQFIEEFLRYNRDYEVFKTLEIEPLGWTSSGSAVPVFENKIQFLESLLPLFNTSDLLKHKLYIEKEMAQYGFQGVSDLQRH